MYRIRHKYLRTLFECLLLASSVVLFGNRLTNRFYLCTSVHGGIVRLLHHAHHSHRGHTDFGVHYGKILASVDKRYHAPLGVALDEPVIRLLPVTTATAPPEYVLSIPPAAPPVSCLFLRGPPQG